MNPPPNLTGQHSTFTAVLKEQEEEILELAAEQHELYRHSVQEAFRTLHHQLALEHCHGTFGPAAVTHQPMISLEETRSPLNFSPRAVSPALSNHETLEYLEKVAELEEERPGSPSEAVVRTKSAAAVLDLDKEADLRQTRQKLRKHLDYAAAVLVLLDSLLNFVELELGGRAVNPSDPETFEAGAWHVVEIAIGIVFLVEWCTRVAMERREFCLNFANWFDTILVLASLVEGFLLILSDGGYNLAQTAHMLRQLRVLRALRLCPGLQLLLKACQSFLRSLFWSMALLLVFLLTTALVLAHSLKEFIADERADFDDRVWVWNHYGTAARACYSLFEITFAGSWPVVTRPVVEKVSPGFAIIFVVYITIIVFALIRVITAVFLKDTLDTANNDAELLMMEKMHKKAEFAHKLEDVFLAITVGEGLITEERLAEVLQSPKVKAYFQTLDLDVHEGTALFHLLDDGDGTVTLDEFIDGVMRCKGPARAIDQVATHAEIKQLDKKLSKVLSQLAPDKESELRTTPRVLLRQFSQFSKCSTGSKQPHNVVWGE
ncbi:unnamed protein product [Effrenium voratum]|uniref:Ion transport domain-containing protein n=1 Tax=Effrenium voratum TaxID=2562239 RepID=A0AA36MKP0_9DINO|nr:unnamed protein product [Effrenium voratum]CAJ1415021.1 unnamed protein product [Effrenium voratum]